MKEVQDGQGKNNPQHCKKIGVTDPAGTLDLRAGALERDLRKVKHSHTFPLLDLTLGEVLDVPSDSGKTRIPRRCKQGKCSRRVCPMQLQGNDSVVPCDKEAPCVAKASRLYLPFTPNISSRHPRPFRAYARSRTSMSTMRDGIRLAVDIFLPEEEGRYPALLSTSPYLKEHPAEAPSLEPCDRVRGHLVLCAARLRARHCARPGRGAFPGTTGNGSGTASGPTATT